MTGLDSVTVGRFGEKTRAGVKRTHAPLPVACFVAKEQARRGDFIIGYPVTSFFVDV
jgi:hypothetical protein